MSLLEVQGQISGNDADIMQMLHRLKLTLLQGLEDVDLLQSTQMYDNYNDNP